MRTVLIALTLTFTLTANAQSSMFRGNPAHTGVYAKPDRPIQGKIAWSFEALNWDIYQTLENMDGGFAWPVTPAVVDHRIYFSSGQYFYAVDESGKLIFRQRLSARSLACPAIVEGLAYIPTIDGKLQALDIRDGSVLWSVPIGSPTTLHQVDNWDVYQSSPVVADGMVYIGSADGRIYAVSAKDGTEKWHFQTKHVVRATPAVADGRVFCGSFDGKVYALNTETGKEIWNVDTRMPGVPWNSVQGSCAVVGGIVYVGSRSCFSFGIEATTGKVLWKHSHDGGWVPSSPAVRDGIAYVGQSDGNKITAIDSTGKLVWYFSSPKETFSSPALAGDVLYVGGNDNYNMNGKGCLSALDIKTGKALWTLELPNSVWASPVVVGNTVYVSCADGKLYAIR